MKLTITEALAELKTIGKRISTKHEAIMQASCRPSVVIDPLAKEEGGSVGWVQRERQSYKDLLTRYRNLRSAIQRANQSNQLTIGSGNFEHRTMSVADWLIWRKEIAVHEENLLSSLVRNTKAARKGIEEKSKADYPVTLVANFDEAQAQKDLEYVVTTKGELDGRLTLFNSTCMIDVD